MTRRNSGRTSAVAFAVRVGHRAFLRSFSPTLAVSSCFGHTLAHWVTVLQEESPLSDISSSHPPCTLSDQSISWALPSSKEVFSIDFSFKDAVRSAPADLAPCLESSENNLMLCWFHVREILLCLDAHALVLSLVLGDDTLMHKLKQRCRPLPLMLSLSSSITSGTRIFKVPRQRTRRNQ